MLRRMDHFFAKHAPFHPHFSRHNRLLEVTSDGRNFTSECLMGYQQVTGILRFIGVSWKARNINEHLSTVGTEMML